MTLRERLHNRMIAKGYSLTQLANESGVVRTTLCGYINKEGNNPLLRRAIRLADALDCTLDYLTGRTDDPCGRVGRAHGEGSTLGERLHNARIAAELSMPQLSALSGICTNAIYRAEHNKTDFRLDVIVLLADELDVSIDFLTGRCARRMGAAR